MNSLLRGILFFLTFFYSQIFAQVITSTAAGGNWSSSSTWQGGIIPAAGNDVIINGPVYADGSFTVSSLTVNSGALLEHDGNYYRNLTINGSIINNGTIRNKPDASYYLTLYAYKAVNNNGIIKDVTLYYMSEQEEQTISGSQPFSCKIAIEGTGDLYAASNIRLDSLGYFDLGTDDSLIMGSFKLTIDQRYNGNTTMSYGTGRIVSYGELEINGKFGANLEGSFVITGTEPLRIEKSFIVYGNMTVGAGKIIEHDGNYYRDITVHGNVINTGTIRNKPNETYYLTLYAYKGVNNNGTIKDITLYYMSEQDDQTISGSQPFGCKISIEGTGDLYAGSDIRLDSLGYFDLGDNDSLIMGNYKLTIDQRYNSNTTMSYGTGRIVSNGELEINGKFGAGLEGDFIITGTEPLRIEKSFIVYGDMTVGTGKIIEHDGNYYRDIKVNGNIINNGIIRNKPDVSYYFTLYAGEGIFNNGEISAEYVYVTGLNTHTFAGNYINSIVTFDTENQVMSGELNCKEVTANYPFILTGGSVIKTPYCNNWQRIINYGTLSSSQQNSKSVYGQRYPQAYIYTSSSSSLDSIEVEAHGNQVPSTYSGAVKIWWRISAVPANTGSSLSTLILYYNDNETGNNNEDLLELYHSTDNGRTWKQVSSAVNTRRNPESNYIQFDNVPAEGDYVLSSNPDPVSVRANIYLSVIGRDRIRIGGAPNRYAIHYVNNSDVTTGEILMSVAGEQGVFIESVEPSVPSGAPRLKIPVDSIAYDGKKDSIYLFISPMAPREERSFDVIFTADNTAMQKPGDAKILPLIGAVIWWGAAAVTTAYVTDVTMNVSENIWQPVGCRTVGEALKDVLYESWQQTNKDWFCYEKPAKAIAEAAAEEMLKRGAGVAIPGKNIVEGAGRSMKGMERYLKGDFNVVTDCDGNKVKPEGDMSEQELELTKVTSWDPNEKNGPKGTGENNFVTSAGRIPYRIFFENKKEAQAPAWKIEIIDTLANEFDPETVVFETKSHEGELYNWQIDKQYNFSSGRNDILRWYIEGIELPPNITPPEGEGYVSFSVETNPGLASGTALLNSATITFDVNAPIRTNVWQNILDFTPPVTTLYALPSEVDNTKLTLRWQADDGANGSGISTTAVYRQINEGGYELAGTSLSDSLVIDIDAAGAYSFYALSKDNVGNVELTYNNIVTTNITAVAEPSLPQDFRLSQNYPNPFNPSTTIRFDLPVESRIKIEVFDIIGQKVITLADKTEHTGYHTLTWNAAGFSSGIYLVRFNAESVDGTRKFRDIKKLMLVK